VQGRLYKGHPRRAVVVLDVLVQARVDHVIITRGVIWQMLVVWMMIATNEKA